MSGGLAASPALLIDSPPPPGGTGHHDPSPATPNPKGTKTMPLAAEKELKHLGESKAAADHDHDMIHELSRRLDAYWRYDQYIANASADPELQRFWKQMKTQEEANIARLKEFIAHHCEVGCF
jgi:hypothetical protein